MLLVDIQLIYLNNYKNKLIYMLTVDRRIGIMAINNIKSIDGERSNPIRFSESHRLVRDDKPGLFKSLLNCMLN